MLSPREKDRILKTIRRSIARELSKSAYAVSFTGDGVRVARPDGSARVFRFQWDSVFDQWNMYIETPTVNYGGLNALFPMYIKQEMEN